MPTGKDDPAGPRPTLRSIAEMTGLAVATVSRALADDPKIARRTRERVAKIAAEIGYVPDPAAQRLRTGRTNVIALVLDPHSEIIDFSGSMISGVAEVVRDTRYHLTLTQYQLGEDPMRPIRHIVRNRLADGLMFARTEPDDARVEFLLAAEFAFVTYGRTRLGPHAWCDYDNAAFARLAVQRLVSKGRRKIAIIPPRRRYSFADHMMQGFARAIQEAGVMAEVPEDHDLSTPAEETSARIARRLAEPGPPDGWICAGEIAAIATNAAICDAGLRLGRDVDLVAKQTSRVFDLFRPKIDTIHEDIAGAGAGMARALLARIAGTDAAQLQELQAPVPGF
ncbi:MAG: LacI family DNA-binding transcriptional regulator [Rhodobacteraceae bacterium]|nr:LacI family DNA-binding transcriptional regulator [Paracoccaceae bacterium]